ncbi:MAG: hypothetical protein BMS9Abin28_0271 [Anaerolineae bacterium]|nr:MAG: hypothetical protein BMS9Abin28_0271 [Anaerolineae bacterium]
MTGPKERTRAPLLDRLKLRKPAGSRVPENSFFYTRLLPALILVLGVLTILLIIFAIGVYLTSVS